MTRRNSIVRRMSAVHLLSMVFFLAISVLFVTYYELQRHKEGLQRRLETLSGVLSESATAPLVFGIPSDGENALASLAREPEIESAVLFTARGDVFATYGEPEGAVTWPPLGAHFSSETVMLVTEIVTPEGVLGRLCLTADLGPTYARMRTSGFTILLIMIASALVTALLSHRLLRRILRPVQELSRLTQRVTESRDYSLRSQEKDTTELGRLAHDFNEMLDQIARRDDELVAIQKELERGLVALNEEKQELHLAQERERDLREKLDASQRIESLGVLAGGVAHDLNNILSPIVGYPDLILDELEGSHPMRPQIETIRDSALRAAAIIQDLLTLARRGSYRTEPLDLGLLVADYLHSPELQELQLRRPEVRLERNISTNQYFSGSAPHVDQVLMNLITNAFEAIEQPHGTVEVYVGNERNLAEKGSFEPIPPGEYTVLRVRDDGCGIEPKHLERVFQPFYSRKEMGRSGSGLGLAVVYGVVKDLGGFIDVGSRLGSGSTFEVYFPAIEERPQRAITEEVDLRGTGRILIVDDNEAQRKLASEVLRTLGYETLTAHHGHAALDVLDKETVDLVVLDMKMEEGFDGLDTLLEVQRRGHATEFLIASGYAETDRTKRAIEAGALAYIGKPFTRAGIGIEVKRAMESIEAARAGT